MTPSDPHPPTPLPDPLTAHIDRTLHALTHPHPPKGLNHRILITLATQHAATPNRLATLLRRHALPLTAAALLLPLATLRLVHHPHPANVPPPRIAWQQQTAPQPPNAPSAPLPTAHLHLTHQTSRPSTSTSNPNQQALADLQTPSFPAPPLPPTPQERLVRLMLRRGEIHNLAQLNPAELSAAAQGEQADFHAFFEPLLILPEPQPSTSDSQTPGDPK